VQFRILRAGFYHIFSLVQRHAGDTGFMPQTFANKYF